MADRLSAVAERLEGAWAAIRALEPDFFVVVAMGQILSQALLDIPRMGPINVHASLLPKYRGAAPIQWALINGEKETGITTMRMDAGMDTVSHPRVTGLARPAPRQDAPGVSLERDVRRRPDACEPVMSGNRTKTVISHASRRCATHYPPSIGKCLPPHPDGRHFQRQSTKHAGSDND